MGSGSLNHDKIYEVCTELVPAMIDRALMLTLHRGDCHSILIFDSANKYYYTLLFLNCLTTVDFLQAVDCLFCVTILIHSVYIDRLFTNQCCIISPGKSIYHQL